MNKIRAGTYGVIYTDGTIAVKKHSNNSKGALNEFNVSKIFDHPNVMKYDDIDYSCNIIMKLCDRDLYDSLNNCSESQLFGIISQICRGLKHIHDCGYVHGDIKSRNILMKDGVSYITDFGTTKRAGEYGIITTITHRPPEQPDKPNGFYTDIWSLGCLIFECVSAGCQLIEKEFWQMSSTQAIYRRLNMPYMIKKDAFEYLLLHQHEFTQSIAHPDSILNDIMCDCLIIDHKSRPTIDDIINKYFHDLSSSSQ